MVLVPAPAFDIQYSFYYFFFMYYTSIFAEVRVDHKDNTFKMSVPEVGVFDVSEADVYSAS